MEYVHSMERCIMTESSVNIKDLIETIIKKWKFILLAIILGAGVAAMFSFFIIKPVYRVTSSLYVGNGEMGTGIKNGFDYKREVESFQLLMPTYKEIAESNAVKAEVLEATGADWTLFELEDMVNISFQGGTQVLNFQVDSPDVKEAMAMADKFVEITKRVSHEIRGIDLVQTLDTAMMPEYPMTPVHTNNVILGGILGAMLSLGLVVGREVYQTLRKRKITL